ncbi:MAG: ornithine carbamoyltransferase, partial [Firmicutes bacterium]|nr:ornithine carbamoyltransferase [Bacillota bacterium]
LKGKTLGMIFQKSSTRTRVSFEVGMWQLGGYALFLNAQDLQMGRGEPIRDTARVLSRYLDGIMIRTFSHQEVQELAHFASIPVINGLTDLLHPCQALADFLTIWEVKGTLEGLKVAYVGDGNNVAHSFMLGCSKLGVDISLASPEGYRVDQEIYNRAKEFASEGGSTVILEDDPKLAVRGAQVVYTDVWTSMGQESEAETRVKHFKNYQVNNSLLALADANAMVLHCLPAHRGEEITEEVLEGPQSYVWAQAENRLHAQKALLALLMA